MIQIKKRKMIFESFLKIEEGIIEYNKDNEQNTFSRERVLRENAACVLIHNIESQSIILTRQFRFAIADKVESPILELMAGKVDDEENPLDAAIRESEEECGYRIKSQNIELIASFFASPGYTTEKFNLYYATVNNADKVSEGGGLEGENEYIEVVEMPVNEFVEKARISDLQDSKTLAAAWWFLANKA